MNKFQHTFIFALYVSCFNFCFATSQVDPLDSPSWESMHSKILNNEPVIFDDRVQISMPDFAEDPMNVPVSVQVNNLENIEEIVIFADLNPIQKVLSFQPFHIKPYLSFRIKVEQSTPVRAAVRTSDGSWHVGGSWLEAAGGGCTAPSQGRAAGNWHETLMNVSSRSWIKNELGRVRFRIMHPMDTGLADGIPEFYLEYFDVVDAGGSVLAKITTYQPISENPVFTLDINKEILKPINLLGVDNNGNRLNAQIEN
ncbi:MAG: quinoprotein dehydrogenase-associated SoxYZ-like carrier [Proteobacteria bacterium]|nr:quinoprotein dehydrogenase-associated SoxYZ-like carrier [Pseudomonadota bacterium]